MPGQNVTGQGGDHRDDQGTGGANPFVVSGLFGQGRDHVAQMGVGVVGPPGVGVELEQVLGDDQAEQLASRSCGFRPRIWALGRPIPGRIRSSRKT